MILLLFCQPLNSIKNQMLPRQNIHTHTHNQYLNINLKQIVTEILMIYCFSKKRISTLISVSFKQWPAIITSPAFSKAKIFSCDMALTSLATTPIDFPSRLPNTLEENKRLKVKQKHKTWIPFYFSFW